MAIYSISYARPGEPPKAHKLTAKSEPEARMRFMNLSWVAFTSIAIMSIAIAADQPEEAKVAVRGKGKRAAASGASAAAASGAARTHVVIGDEARRAWLNPIDWQAACDRLTDEIGRLADEAQALTRSGDHDAADAKRAEAKKLAGDRDAIIKRNKGK